MKDYFEFRRCFESFNGVKTENVYKTEEECLDDILRSFRDFLKGCGFHFEGELTIVDLDFNKKDLDDSMEEKWAF